MAIQDHTADLGKARLAQIDARLAEIETEKAELTEKRKAYTPKRSTAAKASKD
jgi:hypothetical protein